MKNLCLCLALLSAMASFSQSYPFEISGKLVDQVENMPLESATIYLERAKDSSLITYTISNKDGEFSMEDKAYYKDANLFISYVGYKTHYQKLDLSQGAINLQTIKMAESTNELNEVVIKSAAPVTIKKDTLEFNVASFKTAKDASVEDLLKELPGVEVDDEGNITVNGKEVSNIMVNGKPFFGDDPTIATKNLTKELIKKVQVVDTKSKSEAFTGESSDGENKTINLTIDEDKNKGVFGRLAAGAGTDERYEAAGMLNYFNNDRRISVLGSGNNINSAGFSFGEIQKMFGGGNSMIRYGNGTFVIDGRRFGGGQGITTSRMGGLNYADELGKGFDVSADYFYSGSSSENETISHRENILPESRYFTNSESASNADTDSHNANLEFNIEVDSTLLINVKPSFSLSMSKTDFNRSEESLNDADVLTNNSETGSFVENRAKNFSNEFDITKKIGDKGAYLKAFIENELGENESDDYLRSETNTYAEDGTLEEQTLRDQYTDGDNKRNSLNTGMSYRLPLVAKKLFLNFDYSYTRNKTTDVKSTFDQNETTGEFENFNEDQSTDFEYIDESSLPEMALTYDTDKLNVKLDAGYRFRTLKNSDFLRPELDLKRRFENIQFGARVRKKLSEKASVYARYAMRNQAPNLSQLQPFEDVSDPLNIIVGNPDLKPTTSHSIYANLNAYDWQKRSGFFFWFNGTIRDAQVVAKTTVNDDFTRETTYANVDGNYQFSGGGNYNKNFKIDSLNTVRARFSLYGNFNRNINFNNEVQYASNVQAITPSLHLTYTIKDILELRPGYSINFTKNKYDIDIFENENFAQHNFNFRTAMFVPKKLEWRNDLRYQYNPNIVSGLQKSAWFWNATLAYSVLKDQGTITLKAYDLLNQNTNARRNATQNYIEDVESTVLQQYFMLSFSWKFNSLGKKGEIRERNFF